MITLQTPLVIAPTVATFTGTLPFVIEDNSSAKWVRVRFQGLPRPLPIWSGDAYTAAGDYTQAQIEEAVQAKLGDNPAAVLAALYSGPMPPAVLPASSIQAPPAPTIP